MNKIMYMAFIRFVVVIFCFQLLPGLPLQSQSPASVKEYKKVFTTYPFSDPDPIPSFTKIYPYYRYDGFTTKPIQKEWKVVELENDFIKVMILPEIGGKIWTAIEKSTGQPFIYYNNVVKFRDVAMRGPWTSGGLEANYGIIGHTPNCATPVDYTTRKNPDGSVSCIIGVLDLLTRTNWQIDINLPHDKAYFTTGSVWHNPTFLEQPYYHWMNAGLKAKGNLEFIYPGTNYIGHEGEFADWPVNERNQKKISFYEQNNFGGYKSYHVFGKYTDFFGGYWHDDQFGMARYAPQDDKPGKKIWIWGLSGQGMIWEKLLTDNDGQYVEVQSGRLFNQNAESSTFTPFKHHGFAPYATDVWKEYWYPVLKTRGFITANEYGALNFKNEDGWLKVYVSPVQRINGDLVIRENEKILYSKKLSLTPLKTFADSVRVNIDERHITITLGDFLDWKADPGSGKLSRPIESPKDFDWNGVYGLYVQGKEFMDQKLFPQAEEKLREALLKDQNYVPALVKMAELKLRNHQLKESFELATRALSIDTHDGAANYFYGLASMHLNDLVNAKDGFTVAALSVPFRSAAYTELGKIYLKEKQYHKSLHYAAKAIDFNRYNIAAYQVQAICERYLHNDAAAGNTLKIITSIDPLNAFVKAEIHFKGDDGKQPLTNLFQNEQPHQSYLELASFYIVNGLWGEGQKLLLASPESPLAYYWLAWIQNKNGEEYAQTLEKANQLSPLLTFPFRSEMIEVLEWAGQKSNSWKPRYYLALILKEKNQVEASRKIFAALGSTPDFAPFYAARALLANTDSLQAQADLVKAIELDKSEWRYHKLLATHYLALNNYAAALSVAEPFHRSHPGNYVMGMLHAKTLLLNGRYRDCDRLLSSLTIIPFEGATEGRELYREAKLSQALDELKNKNYEKALHLVKQSKLFPENLGVGKPYEQDIDLRLEEWISYLSYKQMKKNADAEKSLQRIIQFRPQIDNTVSNFLPANHLVTAWAMKVKGQSQQAAEWLDEEVKKYPKNKTLLWAREIFLNEDSVLTNESDPTARLLLKLMNR